MTVQLFIPCFMDQLYPQAAYNTIKVLEKAGCKVKYNEQQTCCGQPAFNAGFWSESKDVCTKFVQDFDGADYIVSQIGMQFHYNSISRGVIDTRDLIYFISVIVIFLLATQLMLQKRNWN